MTVCLFLSPSPHFNNSKQRKQRKCFIVFILFLQYVQNGRNLTATVLRALEVTNTVDSVSGSLTL